MKNILLLINFVFCITTFSKNASTSPRVLLPLDLVIVGFDKSINSHGDDLLVLKNLVELNDQDYFELSNSRFETDSSWNRSFPSFISYGITYTGSAAIKANSLISIETISDLSIPSKGLKIMINNIDFSALFEFTRQAHPLKVNNDFLSLNTADAIYIQQGNWFVENDQLLFSGHNIHGIEFKETAAGNNSDPINPNSTRWNAVNTNEGRHQIEECDPCVIKNTIENVGNWATSTGTNGRDIPNLPHDLPQSCNCTGDIFIQRDACLSTVLETSDFICQSSFAYEWVLAATPESPEIVLLQGVHFGAIATLSPYTMQVNGKLSLKVYCGDCVKSSNTINMSCTNPTKREKDAAIVQTDLVKIYPNPTSDAFTLEYKSESNHQIQISIYSSDGQQKFSQTYSTFVGTNKYNFDSTVYPAGNYLIQIHSNNRLVSTRHLSILR